MLQWVNFLRQPTDCVRVFYHKAWPAYFTLLNLGLWVLFWLIFEACFAGTTYNVRVWSSRYKYQVVVLRRTRKSAGAIVRRSSSKSVSSIIDAAASFTAGYWWQYVQTVATRSSLEQRDTFRPMFVYPRLHPGGLDGRASFCRGGGEGTRRGACFCAVAGAGREIT